MAIKLHATDTSGINKAQQAIHLCKKTHQTNLQLPGCSCRTRTWQSLGKATGATRQLLDRLVLLLFLGGGGGFLQLVDSTAAQQDRNVTTSSQQTIRSTIYVCRPCLPSDAIEQGAEGRNSKP